MTQPLRALVFDAYGTLFNVHSVMTTCEALFPGKGGALSQLWRTRQLEYSWLRSLMGRYVDFNQVTRESLIVACTSLGLTYSDAVSAQLNNAYRTLALFDDTLPTLKQLRRQQPAIQLAILSNGAAEMLNAVVAYNKLDAMLDAVLSVDEVAIFKPDQQLVFFNDAYYKLWQLDPQWLKTQPTDGAILDHLREKGKLPPVVNYRDWKAQVLACYKTGAELEDWWHLTDGRILHVVAEQRPDGGVTYLFADETERLSLESRYNGLIDVQRETLDSLKEGVAVFGTDGRLKLSNLAFTHIWKIAARTLAAVPTGTVDLSTTSR